MSLPTIFALMSAQNGQIKTRPDNGNDSGKDVAYGLSNDNNPLVLT